MTSPGEEIALIAAMDRHRLIGKNNDLPWHLPNDLRRFKSRTLGHPVIMGRRTHESIGHVLPGRKNIVLTERESYRAHGATVVDSIKGAIESASEDSGEIFVIGGGSIYRQFLPQSSRCYLTVVHETFEGNTFFPELEPNHWEIREVEDVPPDQSNRWAHSFYRVERRTGSTAKESARPVSLRYPLPPFLRGLPVRIGGNRSVVR